MYISITLSAYINVSTAFGEKHNGLRDSRLSLVRPSGGLRLVADKTTKKKKKIKPRVDYEPRSAHGRAVKKIKPRVDYEPRSAHGRAVKKKN